MWRSPCRNKKIHFIFVVLCCIILVDCNTNAAREVGNEDISQTKTEENKELDKAHDHNIPTNEHGSITIGQADEISPKHEIYLQGIRHRKYHFWIESDDPWSQPREPENVPLAISLLTEAASAGNPDAMYALGEIYEYGETNDEGIPDFNLALKYYTMAASLGNPDAQAALGFMYATGKGVPVSEPISQLYLTFAADAGDTISQLTLGYKYMQGHGVPKSCAQAAEWYELAAVEAIEDVEYRGLGTVIEQLRLSTEVESGRASPTDEEDVVQYYQYSASAGDTQALVTMGNLHLSGGYGVERDFQRALSYFREAANLGDAAGLSSLGYMHANGYGVPQDNATAMNYYLQAANKGNAHAMAQLGILYYNGWGVERNFAEAFKYFSRASEQSFAEAQLYLGHMYHYGYHVAVDAGKALNYYAVAASQGHLSAIYHLSRMHLLGEGTAPHCATAVALLKKVAERGPWAELLEEAHDFFENGLYRTAVMLYERAGEMGFEVAQSNAAWMYDKELVPLDEGSWPSPEYANRQAIRYYSRSAEQHNPGAYVRLGDFYYYGRGTTVDLSRAAKCYQAAEHMHNPQAMFNLGYMHEHGLGLPKDLFLAKRYYDLCLQSNQDAYLAWGLAIIKLGGHFVYEILSGGKGVGNFEVPVGEYIRAVPWDNILILILGFVLIVLVVVRQRQVLR